MFMTIAIYKAEFIPVQYWRVSCVKLGGVRFEFRGNPYFLMVLIYNVGNVGVQRVYIKGSNTVWARMIHSWGQVWYTGINLIGQPLTFYATTSDKKSMELISVVPSKQFGQTYESSLNF